MTANGNPVSIVMIEDDDGHARLIERNIRRAGVNNEILPFRTGGEALRYLMGTDGSGAASAGRSLLILLDLNLAGYGRRRGLAASEGEPSYPMFARRRPHDDR